MIDNPSLKCYRTMMDKIHDGINKSFENQERLDMDFLGYISSLAFQTMVFLGEMPSPVTQKIEKNLFQAKLLIDTLSMLRDKTKGNLDQQEESFLKTSVYELQMKYVTMPHQEKEKQGC